MPLSFLNSRLPSQAVHALQLVFCTCLSLLIPDSPAWGQFSPGQILIKYRANAKPTVSELESLADQFGVLSEEPLFSQPTALTKPTTFTLSNVYRLRITSDPQLAAKAYSSLPGIAYAQPNFLYRFHQAPNDPQFGNQTSLALIGWESIWNDLNMPSQDVTVAIIDSGIDYLHEDLADNIWINQAELDGRPDVDDDQNGYIDDIRGWDFSDTPDLPGKGDYLTRDNDPADESSHGTRVAGIVGAVTNNAKGIAGVAPNAKLMALRAGVRLQSNSGFLEEDDLAAAIIYAVDNGAHIINMSWGSPERAFLIQDALRYAVDNGVVLIASAGNSGSSGLDFPGAFDQTIAVGATDNNDFLASFSSTGPLLDLTAPGLNLLSTVGGNAYGAASGTSFSAPIVSGFAALLLSHQPELNADQVRIRLAESATDLGVLGWDPNYGAGRLSATRFLAQDLPPDVRIISPNSHSASDTDFNILATAFGAGLTGYRISWGIGNEPIAWTLLKSGEPDSNISVSWDLSSVSDTTLILRLEADLLSGPTLEDRIQVTRRQSGPSISNLEFGPVFEGPRQVYQFSWNTDQPAHSRILYRPFGTSQMDTISSGIVDRSHRLTLPYNLPAGSLAFQVLSSGEGGRITLSDTDSLAYVPFRIPQNTYAEIAHLPAGFTADQSVDFDTDGRREIVQMLNIEGQPFSPIRIFERDPSGGFQQVFESTQSLLPWSIGDVNHDGKPDILGAETARLHILTGTTGYPDVHALDRPNLWGGEIADLDGNGQNEILARSNSQRGIQIVQCVNDTFLNTTFLPDPSPGTGGLGPRFVVADFDADGRNGILAGDTDGDLWIYEWDGAGGYSNSWQLEGDDETDARWVGGGADLDGDGDIEFVVARTHPNSNDALNGFWTLEIYGPVGPDTFAIEWSGRFSGVLTTGNGIATGDLNGDQTPELAVCLLPDIYVIRSDAANIYRPVWHETADLTNRPMIGNLDGDEFPEVIFNQLGELRIYERATPASAFPSPQIIEARPLGSSQVQIEWMLTPGALSYRVDRSTEELPFELLAENTLQTVFTDTGLVVNQPVRYRVTALLSGGTEVVSDPVTVLPNPPPLLETLFTLNPQQVAITFNEPMGPESAQSDGYSLVPDLGRPTSAILDRQGHRIVLTFSQPLSPDQNYTLNIRNASDETGVPLDSRFLSYPFTPEPMNAIARADFNGSGRVDFADFILFAGAFNTADSTFDLDQNGTVGFSDFLLFASLFGLAVIP